MNAINQRICSGFIHFKDFPLQNYNKTEKSEKFLECFAIKLWKHVF